jgi:hypothetical protein
MCTCESEAARRAGTNHAVSRALGLPKAANAGTKGPHSAFSTAQPCGPRGGPGSAWHGPSPVRRRAPEPSRRRDRRLPQKQAVASRAASESGPEASCSARVQSLCSGITLKYREPSVPDVFSTLNARRRGPPPGDTPQTRGPAIVNRAVWRRCAHVPDRLPKRGTPARPGLRRRRSFWRPPGGERWREM